MIEDIRAFMGFGVCSREQEERCRKQDGSEKIHQWACENCKKKKIENIHPWVFHLMDLWYLQGAGYPFDKNDLSYQEWIDLGIMKQLLKRIIPPDTEENA